MLPSDLNPDYTWAIGRPQCVQSGVWTDVEWQTVPQNFAGLKIGGADILFPGRPEGWFGVMSGTVAWDDNSGPITTYKRAVRFVVDTAQGTVVASQDSDYHINTAYDNPNDALSFMTTYLQPGVWPNTDTVHRLQVWHNAGSDVCIAQPKGAAFMAAPLLMFTNSSKF